MKTIRTKFEKKFGAEESEAIYRAALGHSNGINNQKVGSDPFKWALLICIGYQCMEVDSYRKHHGITTDWQELKKWIKRNADLQSHDGDVDYLSLMAGVYNEYMPKQKKTEQEAK